jgi:transcriptional regulator with XRE-family HTH domain
MYMGKKRVITPFRRQVRPTYIRAWRHYRGLTLEQAADRVGTSVGGFTHASLSRIERGLQSYSQPTLEALADALGTDTGSLLNRDPLQAAEIWSLWDQAKPNERKLILDLAATIIKRKI